MTDCLTLLVLAIGASEKLVSGPDLEIQEESRQAAHDVIIGMEQTLVKLREKLDLPVRPEQERVISEMAHALIGTGDWTEEQLMTAWGVEPKGGVGV